MIELLLFKVILFSTLIYDSINFLDICLFIKYLYICFFFFIIRKSYIINL